MNRKYLTIYIFLIIFLELKYVKKHSFSLKILNNKTGGDRERKQVGMGNLFVFAWSSPIAYDVQILGPKHRLQ